MKIFTLYLSGGQKVDIAASRLKFLKSKAVHVLDERDVVTASFMPGSVIGFRFDAGLEDRKDGLLRPARKALS